MNDIINKLKEDTNYQDKIIYRKKNYFYKNYLYNI